MIKKIFTVTTLLGLSFSAFSQSQNQIPLSKEQLEQYFKSSNYARIAENEELVIDCNQATDCTAAVLNLNGEVLISHAFNGYFDNELKASFVTVISGYPDGATLKPMVEIYNSERKNRSKRENRDRPNLGNPKAIQAQNLENQRQIQIHREVIINNARNNPQEYVKNANMRNQLVGVIGASMALDHIWDKAGMQVHYDALKAKINEDIANWERMNANRNKYEHNLIGGRDFFSGRGTPSTGGTATAGLPGRGHAGSHRNMAR